MGPRKRNLHIHNYNITDNKPKLGILIGSNQGSQASNIKAGLWQILEPKMQKMPVDATADSASSDSLSFASLVCIQGQQSMPRASKDDPKVQKQEPEFEFSCSNLDSGNRIPSNKLILNGQQATTRITAHQSQVPKQIDLGDLLSHKSPILGDTRTSDMKQTHLGSSRQSYGSKRKTTNETGGKKSFSEKLLLSLVKPCRDCRTSNPRPITEQQALKWGDSLHYTKDHFSSFQHYAFPVAC